MVRFGRQEKSERNQLDFIKWLVYGFFMAKKSTSKAAGEKPGGALSKLANIAEEIKADLDILQAEIVEIDKEADEKKKPMVNQIKELNEAHHRITGKYLIPVAGAAASSGSGAKRSKRNKVHMEALAVDVYNFIAASKDGVSMKAIRDHFGDRIMPQDNVTSLMKFYKGAKIKTTGPKIAMIYSVG